MADEPEPLWITYTRAFYRRLYELSEVNEYGQRVFEGNVNDVYREVAGNSLGYYSRVVITLRHGGAIRFVRRGNRYQSSLVELLIEGGELQPDNLPGPDHLTPTRHAATMVAEVEREVKSLTAWRESLEKGGLDVAKVLLDFELRISKLEREVKQIGKKAK